MIKGHLLWSSHALKDEVKSFWRKLNEIFWVSERQLHEKNNMFCCLCETSVSEKWAQQSRWNCDWHFQVIFCNSVNNNFVKLWLFFFLVICLPAGPPVIVIPPKSTSLNMSKDASLTCQAVADPPNMTYVWQKNGENVYHVEWVHSLLCSGAVHFVPFQCLT